MKLRYTPRAKLDIAEIHDYIAQENPLAAKRVILLIRKAAESLPQNPQIGRAGRIAGTRELTVGRFPFMLGHLATHYGFANNNGKANTFGWVNYSGHPKTDACKIQLPTLWGWSARLLRVAGSRP